MSNYGFARLSKKERRQTGRKGGRIAHEDGVAHTFSVQEAKLASQKAVAARKAVCVQRAALRLLKAGFTPKELSLLELDGDAYVYYGGSRMGPMRLKELRDRIDALTVLEGT